MSNSTMEASVSMREVFIAETARLLWDDPRSALVLAAISAGEGRFADAARDHPDRVVNVGIREQLMVGVAGGLALTGLRPIVHTYAPFLVERAFEQVKLDLGHQGVGAVLVSVGASYDWSEGGFTHFSPRDVALFDTIEGWRVHVPGHAAEVAGPLTRAVAADDSVYIRLSDRTNREARPVSDRLTVLRRGSAGLVIAVGPTLDPVLAATEGLDVTVAYATTVRPFDTETLRELGHDAVAIVEPYLAGTSSHVIGDALADRPHRLLSLGVGVDDLHRFGTPEDHDRWHGLTPDAIRARLDVFLGTD
ncbi:transketolase family protein [Stackebrandtia soli]|uniref:transketolase family protein n=1 Tax=Stackebrandtia soli TaxID=1892856 RepID=UPI0039EC2716